MQFSRVIIFGEHQGYAKRIYLVYSGIHFDSVTFTTRKDLAVETKDQGLVEAQDSEALALAVTAMEEERAQGKFTDVASFPVRCVLCKEKLKGQAGCVAHAKAHPGHVQFEETPVL